MSNSKRGRVLTGFALPSINFVVQIHYQLLEHLVWNKLQLSSSYFQLFADVGSTGIWYGQVAATL